MTKEELAEIIAREHGLTKARARRIVRTLVVVVRETVAAGDSVCLQGLGTFGAVQARARVGQNPRTGERVAIAAARRPRFIAGRALCRAVRNF
jgi:DNA-binding protein HU-beta